jgi:hypothetical protein
MINGVRIRCSTVELSPTRSPQKWVQRRALDLLPDGCEEVVVPFNGFEVPQSDQV